MEILTVNQVAEMFKCSKAFVYKHYDRFGGFKIAGIIRFSKENLENLMEKGNDPIQAPEKMDV